MILDHRNNMVTNQCRLLLSMPAQSIRWLVTTPVDWMHYLWKDIFSHKKVIAENERLRLQRDQLMVRLERWRTVEEENRRLRALLDTVPYIDGRVLGARILSTNIRSDNDLFLLNKGRVDGVFVGQTVLDAQGFLGQIIRVGWFDSILLPVTNVKSALPVEVLETGEQGILVGTEMFPKLLLNNISKTSAIKKGDLLVTSDLGHCFPGGYPVGYVESIQKKQTEMFAKIEVKPIVGAHKNEIVFLLWPSPQSNSYVEPIPSL